jgi:hypothetical protein
MFKRVCFGNSRLLLFSNEHEAILCREAVVPTCLGRLQARTVYWIPTLHQWRKHEDVPLDYDRQWSHLHCAPNRLRLDQLLQLHAGELNSRNHP